MTLTRLLFALAAAVAVGSMMLPSPFVVLVVALVVFGWASARWEREEARRWSS
jgi:hypothetical protein